MSERLVTVASFGDAVEAALARNVLAEAGIQTYLSDEATVAIDWSLGNALGGIKLQVHPRDAERAEFLLSREARVPDEEESADAAAIAPAETAAALTAERDEDLRAEREDRAEINRLADRAYRSSVMGLLFFPVQFYALWLLLNLRYTEGRVSPDRRWKVWAAALLNIPLLSLAAIPVVLLVSLLPDAPAPERFDWQPRAFEAGFAIRFPHYPQYSVHPFKTGYGEGRSWRYAAAADGIAYTVDAFEYPKSVLQFTADEFFKDELDLFRQGWNARLINEAPIEVNGHPGRELTLEFPDGAEGRSRFVLVGRKLFVVTAAGPRLNSLEVQNYFNSFAPR